MNNSVGTTVTSKGQVTIPKLVRDSLGIVPGSKVVFAINDIGQYVVTPVTRTGKIKKAAKIKSRFDVLIGTGNFSDMTTDEYMNLLRGYDEDKNDPGFR